MVVSSFKTRMAKTPELRSILGRCISVSYRAEFYISFFSTGVFIYVYDPDRHDVRFLAYLTLPFFSEFDCGQEGLTFGTDNLIGIFRSVSNSYTVGKPSPRLRNSNCRSAPTTGWPTEVEPGTCAWGSIAFSRLSSGMPCLISVDVLVKEPPLLAKLLLDKVTSSKHKILTGITNTFEPLEAERENYFFVQMAEEDIKEGSL